MAHTPHRRPLASSSVPLRLALSVLVAVLCMSLGPMVAIATEAGRTGQVVAQATRAVDDDPAPRLQPVGNGDTIDSPVETAGESGSGDTSWWWRIAFGAAVVVVVLIALIQRRHVPDRAGGPGRGPNGRETGRRNDRNALGH